MQIALTILKMGNSRMWRHAPLAALTVWMLAVSPARAVMAYVSNEKSNTVSVIDSDTWTVTRAF